jgi:hypothetical protein
MSQFRSTGGLDDSIAADGDRGFYGVNRRLQLNQLQEGEVRESLNGRMEGYWKPRKAVIAQKTSLTTAGTPLRLPFYTINTSKSITAASVLDGVLSLTITSHGFDAETNGYATISGLAGNVTINGVRELTYVDANTMSCVVAGLTTISDQTGTLSATLINDNVVSDVRASCLFSNPNETNKEYILVATNAGVKKIEVSKLADAGTAGVTDLTFPTGITLDAGVEVSMIQAFDKVIIFRGGQSALQWDGVSTQFYKVPGGPYQAGKDYTKNNNIVISNGTATVTIDDADLQASTGIAVGGGGSTIVLPHFFDDGFKPSVLNDFYNGANLVISGTTYTVSDYVGATRTLTLSTGTFTSGTNYTFTALEDTPFSVGQSLRLTQTSTAFKVLNVGDILNVSAIPTYNTWRFFTSEPDVSSHTINYSQQESIGLGFSYMPGPPWATYFQRRLWMPYLYENGGTLTVSTYTNRGIADEIIASDILDSNTYDRVLNQFRISGGTADYVVAMHGFYDDALVVMNRNSIHAVVGTQGSLADTVVKELTSEVGCLSRKSVVMQANNLIFLSDNGVYALTFLNDYNLRGTEEPLSKNIQPYIDRINARLAGNATAVYYDNRYYLAVPLDSVVGADDALGNNAILVFNFLNKGWESLDTYGSSGFLITDFVTAGAGVRNDLYAVSSSGGIHKMEAVDSPTDSISAEFGSATIDSEPINSSLTTRGYDFGTQERKRFTDFQTQMQSFPAGSPSTFDVSFSTEDPDNAFPIGSTNNLIGDLSNGDNEEETANVRGRLGGLRGYTGTMILTRTSGSPKVHSVKISGAVSNRAIISQK